MTTKNYCRWFSSHNGKTLWYSGSVCNQYTCFANCDFSKTTNKYRICVKNILNKWTLVVFDTSHASHKNIMEALFMLYFLPIYYESPNFVGNKIKTDLITLVTKKTIALTIDIHFESNKNCNFAMKSYCPSNTIFCYCMEF